MSAEVKKALKIPADLDKKSIDSLAAAIAKNGSGGFDYLKFKQSLNAMEGLDLDAGTSIKSAFATAKTIGLTKSALVNSAKRYLNVLMSERSKFDEALNNQVKQRVASKKDEVVKLQHRIEEYKKKIADLEGKIGEYQSKIDNADEAVEKAREKIRLTKDKFENTFNAFVEVIKADIEQINNYL